MRTTERFSKASRAKTLKHLTGLSPEFTKAHSDVEREDIQTPLEKNTSIAEKQKLLEKSLEHEISHNEASPNLRLSSGSVVGTGDLWREMRRRTINRVKNYVTGEKMTKTVE